MHIAFDIKSKFFDVLIEGQPSTREALLKWDVRDRLGVVVTRPYGGLDALMTIMLSATAFYDAEKRRRRRPLYPDMFLFHVGGPWGLHMALDFFPDHKELLVASDPREVLRSINHVGITHLLVPDQPRRPVKHRYKEPESAVDRVKQAYAYGHAVEGADVTIRSTAIAPMIDTAEMILKPDHSYDRMVQMRASPGLAPTSKAMAMRAMDLDEVDFSLSLMKRRKNEVAESDPDRLRHLARFIGMRDEGYAEERLRRISTAAALEMLGSPDRGVATDPALQ